MILQTFLTLPESRKEEYRLLMQKCGIRDEGDAELTVLALDEEEYSIQGCGSLSGNILKQIGVNPEYEGEGWCSGIVSTLAQAAFSKGRRRLFLYTKPEKESVWTSLGFFPLVKTKDALMMENTPRGLSDYLESIKASGNQESACIVCNCNPMTKGHLHLIKKASSENIHLYVFVVSEEGLENGEKKKSTNAYFTARERYDLVKRTLDEENLHNVTLCHSEYYLVSRASFPAYFLKESINPEEVRCDLDLTLFTDKIAPALKIRKRYVGKEPFCPVTAVYNERMKKLLPEKGIEVVEIPRYEGISASKVRSLIREGKAEAVKELVPEPVYRYIREQEEEWLTKS